MVRHARYLLGVSRHRVALSVIPVGDEAWAPAFVPGVPAGRRRPARLSAKPIRRVPRHHGRVLASIREPLLCSLPVRPLLPIRGDRPIRLASRVGLARASVPPVRVPLPAVNVPPVLVTLAVARTLPVSVLGGHAKGGRRVGCVSAGGIGESLMAVVSGLVAVSLGTGVPLRLANDLPVGVAPLVACIAGVS